MSTMKKIAASMAWLGLLVALAAFIGAAGGAKWGTDAMGTLMGAAVLIWLVSQPLFWMGADR
jgi:hypothetical protein